MTARLKKIVVENFKSYRGRVTVALDQFNAVIGPNGTGKSNLMDAISFVMGEKTQNLRVKRLSALIYGASINRPVSKSASVTVVLTVDDGREIAFQRSIQGSSSEYKIDGTVVHYDEYFTRLQQYNINVKAKNFLVFQGTVESIALQEPKERTQLFEKLCGSGELEEEYTRLEEAYKKAQDEMTASFQQRKAAANQKKEASLEMDEVKRYSDLKDDLNNGLLKYQLFRLFYNEGRKSKLTEDLKIKSKDLKKIENKKKNLEESLKETKKANGVCGRELAKMEQETREAEVEASKKKLLFVKMKEKVEHARKKIDSASKNLNEAKKSRSEHLNEIKKLEDELANVLNKKSEYEAQIQMESQSQGIDIVLQASQMNRYRILKEKATVKTRELNNRLESLNEAQRADQDKLDNFKRNKKIEEDRRSQRLIDKEKTQARLERLQEYIRSNEEALLQQNALKTELDDFSKREETIQKQLEDINDKLGHAKHEANRKEKQAVLERLKNFKGVYDRLINLVRPIDRRYNVAITKCFGRNMDAIVCDNEKTAQKCIRYLSEQQLTRETFLPLDYLSFKPVDEKLRNITNPKGVKLLYDLLDFEPTFVNAVLYVTENSLVCETLDDARFVAYELDNSRYHNALSLDGTYFKKSGIISGGSVDVEKRAKRWDDKHLDALRAENDKLVNEQNELRKKKKNLDLRMLQSRIDGNETRLRMANLDKAETQRQLESIEEQITKADEEIEKCTSGIETIEKNMEDRRKRIEELNLKLIAVEDQIFAEFCEEIDVPNIRQYERNKLKEQEEKEKKTFEFDQQMEKIKSMLKFFDDKRDKETLENVKRWESVVNQEKETLETCKRGEKKIQKELDKILEEIEKMNKLRLEKKKQVDASEATIKKIRKDITAATKEVQTAGKLVLSFEEKIELNKTYRHKVLMECKMEGIDIPLIEGSMNDLIPSASDLSQSEDSSQTLSLTAKQYEIESRIIVNYDGIDEALKDLDTDEAIDREGNKLLHKVTKLKDLFSKITAPNMKAEEKFQLACGKLETIRTEFHRLKSQLNNAQKAFNLIKKRRYDLFTNCLEKVNNQVDPLYKGLTRKLSAQAFLCAKNPEQPYLAGIVFHCNPPGKRCRPMPNLSGGEKTMAALALILAMHTYNPSPFLVLDEIDAALDKENLSNVVRYIRSRSEELQTIVISHHELFYSRADKLVGIYAFPDEERQLATSKLVTLSLQNFSDSEEDEDEQV